MIKSLEPWIVFFVILGVGIYLATMAHGCCYHQDVMRCLEFSHTPELCK